jgi:hypothetical protein
MPTKHITAKQYREDNGLTIRKPKSAKEPKSKTKDTQLEKDFDAHLHLLQCAKGIKSYRRLRQNNNESFVTQTQLGFVYTPDYVVVCNDNSLIYVEVKGYCRLENLYRFVFCAEMYKQYRFVMIRKNTGVWCIATTGKHFKTMELDLNSGGAELPKGMI